MATWSFGFYLSLSVFAILLSGDVCEAKQGCKIVADIGILVDSSGSLKNEFHKEKQFVKDIAKALTISKSGVNIGVVTFSYYAELSIKLSDNTDTQSFVKDVDEKVRLLDHQTYIDRGLHTVNMELFTEANGDRKDAPNFLFLLTDGRQEKNIYSTPPELQAEALRNRGVTIIAIGIGSKVDALELATFAGSLDNVLLPNSFDDLLIGGFLQKIVSKTCAEATEQPTVLCSTGVDIGFLVDSSYYNLKDFANVQKFIKNIVKGFAVNATGPRAGLASFQDDANLMIPFSDYETPRKFRKAVDSLRQTGELRRIDKGISLAYNDLFSVKNGARHQVPHLLFIITTGKQTPVSGYRAPKFAAESFHEVGKKIIALGIGPSADKDELISITKDPSSVFMVSSSSELAEDAFWKRLTIEACFGAVSNCKSLLDLGFIVDSSGSLRKEYHKEKEFVKTLAKSFHIGLDATRAGIITFSYDAEHSVKLSDYDSVGGFNAAVDGLPMMNSITRIDKALKLAQTDFFTPKNGGRPGVSKMLILLTDGSQTPDPDVIDPGLLSAKLRRRGIQIIVIGIGKKVNETELAHIAGHSSKVYTASNFDFLLTPEFIKQVSQTSCKTSVGDEEKCHTVADVGFVLDSSGSMGSEYPKEKQFIKMLAERLQISSLSNGARAALVLFSKIAKLKIKFSDPYSLDEFKSSVDSLPLMDSITRIDRALKVAYNEMFNVSNGARQNVSKVLVLLTDGKQTVEYDSITPAEAIKPFHQDGITVIVIGIGPAVDPRELVSMVKDPKNMYRAKDFNQLKSQDFISRIYEASCYLPIQNCSSNGDFFFVIDSSGSIGENFVKEKNFMKKFVSSLAFSSRAGIVTFADHAVTNLKIADFKSKKQFNSIAENLSLIGTTTRIDKGLKMVRDELKQFKAEDFARYPKLVFLLTDGSQTPDYDVTDPSSVGEEIRKMGAHLFVVGIGSATKKKELTAIAGNSARTLLKNNFNHFNSQSFAQEVSRIACKAVYEVLTCDSVIDLAFALDSTAASHSQFEQQKNFIKDIAKRFIISSDNAHIGMVYMNKDSVSTIQLNQAVDIGGFHKAVDGLKFKQGQASIGDMLKATYSKLFSSKKGARSTVPQILVLLTSEDDPDKVSGAVNLYREANIKIIVISVGKNLKKVKLLQIVDGKDDLVSVKTPDYLQRDRFIDDVTQRICIASVPKCQNPVSVGFILDSSGSLESEYGKEKQFIKSMAEAFTIHETGSRAGVVTFSHEAELSIRLTDHKNTRDFQNAVDKIGFIGHTTRIDKALLLAKNKLMTEAKSGMPRILILLTDGVQTQNSDALEPAVIAKDIRDMGIKLVVIGIGRGVVKEQLLKIAGTTDNAFHVDDFDQLQSGTFISKVSKAACQKAEDVPDCAAVADVGFIVDSSGSLSREYGKEKDFVKEVASGLDISSKGSHVGVVLFSYHAKLSIKFSDYTNYKDFESAVDNLPLLKSTTRIDKALTLAYDQMFNERNGMRVKAPKVLILLTDGAQSNEPGAVAPKKAVARFHDADIKVIVIGIGSKVNRQELKSIVTSEDNLYIAEDFDRLKSKEFVKTIIGSTCLQASVAPCDNTADIGFVVDSSGSLRREFDREKQFVKSVSNIFDISPAGGRAGLVTFSYDAELSAKLSEHKSASEFRSAVDKLPFMGYTTRIDKGLKVAEKQLFLQSNGGRAAVPKVLFVLTDGAQTNDPDTTDPAEVAKRIRDSGITMFVIGIGNKVKVDELARIAGDEKRLFLAKNFDHLNSAGFLEKISNRSCPAPAPPPPSKIKRCRGRADVGFIVDSSGSLKDDYDKEKSFVKSVATRFDIREGGSHAGIVLFSGRAQVKVGFSEKNDVAIFNKTIDELPLFGKSTRIDRALDVAQRILFQPSNGMRLDVPQVLIVLTDGKQTNAVDAVPLGQAVAPFHESGVKVIAIGVGSNVKRDELKSMVKSEEDLYLAKNFDQLISGGFIDNITAASCQAAPKCEHVVDVGFIVDSSKSVRREYGKEKEFVKALADSFAISKTGSRGAVITFSWHAEHSIKLSDYKNVSAFKNAVDRIPLLGHTTRIDKALRLARDELFTSRNGARASIPKLLVLLTDGAQSADADAVDPGVLAKEIRQAGVKLIVIGIGSKVDSKELLHMAGDKSNLYEASNFDELISPSFLDSVSKTGCELSKKPFQCDAVADIGFILDSAGRDEAGFLQQKHFVQSIADVFGNSSRASRFGVITSDKPGGTMMKLTDHARADDFKKAIERLKSSEVDTLQVDEAIKRSSRDLFSPANGGREDVPKILIIVSSRATGDNVGAAMLSKAVGQLHEDRTKVIVIAVGPAAGNAGVKEIAREPSDVYVVKSYPELASDALKARIGESACKSTVSKCRNVANVGFIVDSSGSLRREYGKEKAFVKQIAEVFEISQAGSRAGVVTFSHVAELSIGMNKHNNLKDFNKAVDELPLFGFTTRIDKALKVAKDQLMVGSRSDAPKLVFLLTDGSQTWDADAVDPSVLSKELRDDGIELIVIGIGANVKVAELESIAGKKSNVFLSKDFDDLQSRKFVQEVSKAGCTKVEDAPDCAAVADVGFIVDSSGSLSREYGKEKDFVKEVASGLDISSKGSHVGVVLFSNHARLSIKFADYINYKDFESAVDNLPLLKSTTRIDKALTLAYDQMFNERNGMRVKAPKVLILLTDGAQSNEPGAVAPKKAVARFHDADIKVIVIGIGSKVNRQELKSIVTSEDNLYIAEDFDRLKSKEFVKTIIGSTCLQASVAPCDNTADIGFVVDSSGSLRREFDREKQFVKSVSNIFDISPAGGRAGLVTFSYDAELSAKLSEHKSASEFRSAVDKLPFMGYTTRIDKGLKVAEKQLFLQSNGGRAAVPKVLFVLTDGAQTNDPDTTDPAEVAKRIRDSGITMFVIGIGNKVKVDELARIAGDEKRLFLAKNFDHLNSAGFLEKISNRSCPAPAPPPPSKIKRCRGRADVGFIVDSSGSLKDDYDKEKSFVKSVATRFDIREGGSHAGIVLFSGRAQVKVGFSEKNDVAIFNKTIDELPLFGKSTRIDRALDVAQRILFQPSNGMRLDVPQVLIVLTDGKQTNAVDAVPLGQAVAPFHESGVKVIAIGVGSNVKRDELKSMVKSEEDLYLAKNFDQLISGGFIDNITAASCQAAPKCEHVVDVGFIVDSSKSVRREYGKEKEFVKALADSFAISKTGSRGAVITFSWHAEHSIKLSDYKNVSAFKNAVDRIPLLGHTTRIDKALRLARDELFTSRNGARASIPKLLVLLTDGAQSADADAVDPGVLAKEIRQAGVKLIVIGIGSKVDSKELLHMAGDKSNLYEASNFDELISPSFLDSVSKTGCELSKKPFQCDAVADIGFILDSAGRDEAGFLQQKHFVQSIADVFGNSSRASRFGVITSDKPGGTMMKLTDHARADDFKKAIERLKSSEVDTLQVDEAIKRSSRDLFSPANGGREDVPKILIIVSSRATGDNVGAAMLSKAVGQLHEDRTKVIVITVGPAAGNAGVKEIAREPSDVYVVKSYPELASDALKARIGESACKSTVSKCRNVANVGFIVDSSGSLRREYGKEKAFVKQIAEVFEISQAGSRAGVVTFSHVAELSIGMNKHNNLKDFNKAVDELPLFGFTTRIDKALKVAKDQLMVGSRSDAPKLVFLLTDGSQTWDADAVDPSVLSKELRDDGIELIVIGIGANVKVAELESIAGKKSNVFLSKDFDDLQSRKFVQEVSKAGCTKVEDAPDCAAVADVGFIVDSSGSLSREYGKEKDFVKEVASGLDISSKGSHVGVVLFSDHARLSIKFADYTNYKDFESAVDNLPLLKSTTRIDKALTLAYDQMFNERNGMRVKAPKVLILLTDGAQSNELGAVAPKKAVARFHDADIKVIVIGIGSKVNRQELKSIVTSEDNLYIAEDFDRLKSKEFVKTIIGSTCLQASVAPCDNTADIGFVVDSSGSLRREFDREKQFVKSVSNIFDISPAGGRAGLVTFSYDAELSAKLSEHKSASEFRSAVDKLPFMGYTTRIDKGLKVAEKQLFLQSNGGRAAVPKVLFVLTDGAQTNDPDTTDPAEVAKRIRDSGITMFVIGIGNKVKVDELARIAGDEKRLFLAKNFDHLNSAGFLEKISNRSCPAPAPPPPSKIKRCRGRADVGFIVDSSGSLKDDYDKEKSFVKSVATRFDIREGGSHAGIVLFSGRAQVKVGFSEKNDVAIFNKTIDELPLFGKSTRIDRALDVAQRILFQPSNGMRLDVPQVLIVLTDGKQTNAVDAVPLGQAVAPFHESGVKVIAIGVGSNVKRDELKSMVKSEEDLYLAKNFDQLISGGFIDNITAASCQAAPKCEHVVDVGFIVDSSKSVRREYGKEKEFVKALADSFAISKTGSRGAVITFSWHAEHSIKLSDYKNVSAFKNAVDRIPLLGHTTRIDKALRLARDELFTSRNGARASIPKLLVLLTDGAQSADADAVDPGVLAKEIRQAGVKLIVIGIGSKVDSKELLHMAGDKSNLYEASNFDELISPSFLDSVSKTGCELSKKPFQCDAVADIGFILDSAGRDEAGFLQQKHFVQSIADVFGNSSRASRFGVITSDKPGGTMMKLTDHARADDFKKAIERLKSSEVDTLQVDEAIKRSSRDLFSPANGGREDVPKILIIVSSRATGDNVGAAMLSKAVGQLHEDRTKVIVIAVGPAAGNAGVKEIAREPSDVYAVKSYPELASDALKARIGESACKSTVSKCRNVANVGFIVDSSGSLRREYGKEKAFVKQIAEVFEISQAGSRAGVVTFSHVAELSIGMNKHNNLKDFNKAVDELPLFGFTTRIDKALKVAKDQLMVGSRSDAPKLVFLLTDGSQTWDADAVDPSVLSKELRDDGIELIVIGIGANVKVAELESIAGKKSNVFLSKDFDDLQSRKFVQEVSKAGCTKVEDAPDCAAVADVGFIVDSSGSLSREYGKEKDFVKEVASGLDISSKGSHVGVVLFSDHARLSIKFADYTNYKDFESAVDNLPLLKSTTRIDKALTLAYDQMFNERNGMRVKAPKVLILLTDGAQSNEPGAVAPKKAVARFHDADIKVIVIGIGSKVNRQELKSIVTSEDNLYIAEDFDRLKSKEFVKTIIGSTCLQASVAPCDNTADIGFVVDSSGSLRREFDREKQFVKSVSNIFDISPAGGRAGLVTFSYDAELSAKLSEHKSASEFRSAVDKLPFMGYTTRIDKGLKVAEKQLFLQSNGGRAAVPKVLFVLTDGAQTNDPDTTDPAEVAKRIRDSGITMFVIGIGNKVKVDELARIAGDEKRLFLAKNFDHLNSAGFLEKISNRSCPAPAPPPPSKIKRCRGRADVGFIVDSSGSLKDDYDKEKSFVKSVATRFDIREGGSHAGIVLFSGRAQVKVGFSEKNDVAIFNKTIDELPLFGKSTRIDKALDVAQRILFQPSNGMRLDVPQVLIVLTDGKQTNAVDAVPLGQAVAPFHESGVKVIAIGVGSNVKRDELKSMVKSEEDLYLAKNFDQLISGGFINNITAASCQAAPKCEHVVDVGFIVDSSKSVRREYGKEKEFVKALADSFAISKTGSRGAVITFSWHAEHSIKLSDYKNVSAFKNAVDRIPLLGHTTRIDKALRLARDELFTSRNGARASIPKLLVLLTDGAQSADADAVDPGVLAKEIRQAGVKLIVIGIGSKVDSKELLHMAGDKSNLYEASNFDELISPSFLDSVSKTGCELSKKPFQCDAVADIGFILDSAGRDEAGFLQQKHFVQSIADVFGNSSRASRFGVITSDKPGGTMMKLTDHARADDFKKAIERLKSSEVDTLQVDEAIKRSSRDLFSPANGGREDVPKILIIVSSRATGDNVGAAMLSKAVGQLHEDRTKVIVIAVGPAASNAGVKEIAREPSDVYVVKSYPELASDALKARIGESACKSTVSKCRNVANVGFIVDSSGSLRREYGKEKAFVKQIAEVFEISQAGSRAGVVTFSHVAELSIGMNKHNNLKDFNKAVDELPLFGFTTRIDKALKVAKDQLMVGSRSDAPKLVFLLTDGSQTWDADAVDPSVLSKELRDDGIELIVIGIGANVKVAELESIAGKKSNVFLSKDFDDLQSRKFLESVASHGCEKAELKCIGTGDIGFIVDSSGTLIKDYYKEKEFLKNVLVDLKVSPAGFHAGAVVFSDRAILSIKFSDSQSTSSIVKKINDLPLLGSTTRIDRALQVAFNELFTVANGMRAGVPKVLVLLTDGRQTQDPDAISPRDAVKPFHSAGIKVIVIGIGTNINRAELASIVKSKEDLYFAKDLDELKSKPFVKNITSASCKQFGKEVKKPSSADIAFIMDTSLEIHENEFDVLKILVTKLAGGYIVSSPENRVGALLFSDEKWHTIPFHQYANSTKFGGVLKRFILMNSVTPIEKQLKLAYENLFSPSGSSRAGVPKVIVLITHEESLKRLDRSALEEVMRPIQESGIRVLVASVGQSKSIPFNDVLTRRKEDVFMVSDFRKTLNDDFLNAFLNASMIIIGLPREPDIPTIPPPGGLTKPFSCKDRFDIAVFLDVNTAKDPTFSIQLKFLTMLTKLFEISPTNSRFSIGRYGKNANVIIPFSDAYAKQSSLDKAMQTITYLSGEQIDGVSLKETISELFGKQTRGRKVIVIITTIEKAFVKNTKALKLGMQEAIAKGITPVFIVIGDGRLNQPAFLSRSLILRSGSLGKLSTPEFALNAAKKICSLKDSRAETCASSIDVIFSLDATQTGSNSLANQKEAVKMLIKKLSTRVAKYRIGIVVYGSYALTTKSLTQLMSSSQVIGLIDNLVPLGNSRRLDVALSTAYTMFRQEQPAGMDAVPNNAKILVVFVSGADLEQGKMSPRDAARPLHDLGVKTIAITVGGSSHADAVKEVVESPMNVLSLAKGQLGMETLATSLLDKICQEAKTYLVELKRCKTAADLVFLIDSSSSMRRDYAKQLNVVANIAKKFGIGLHESRAAVVLFGRYAKVEIPFSSGQSLDAFNDALKKASFIGGHGRLDKGLHVVQSLLLGFKNGAKKGVPKVLFVITDGSQTGSNDKSIQMSAEMLKNINVPIIILGIGGVVNGIQMETIAGSSRNVFISKDINSLSSPESVDTIVMNACNRIHAIQKFGPGITHKPLDYLQLQNLIAYQLRLNAMIQQMAPNFNMQQFLMKSHIKVPNSYSCALTTKLDKTLQRAFSGRSTGLHDLLQTALALNATSFVDIVYALDMADEVTNKGAGMTLFLPSNEAFMKLTAEERNSLKNPCTLKKIIRYHMAEGRKYSSQLENNQRINTLINKPVHYSVFNKVKSIGGAKVISPDNPSGDGVIHVLDRLLFLPGMSLYETIIADPSLKMFTRSLLQSGNDKYLKGIDQMTVFAPSDTAFNSLPRGMLARLLLRPTMVEEIIRNHIHKGVVYIRTLNNGGYGVLTLSGRILRINVQRPKPATINLDATLTFKDKQATNGVLHIIDKVLLP
eukprot:gene5383-6056_t